MNNNPEDTKPPPPPMVMNPNNTNVPVSNTNNVPMNYKKNFQNPVHYNKSGNTNQVMNRNYHNGNFTNTVYLNNLSVPYGTNNNYVVGSYNSNRAFNYPNFSKMHSTNATGGIVNPPRVNSTNVNYFMNQSFTVSKIPQPPLHVNMNVSSYNKNNLSIQKGIPPAPPALMIPQNNMNMNMNSYIPPAPPTPAPAPAPPPPPLPMNMIDTKRDQRNYSEEYTGMQRHNDNNVYVHNNCVVNSLHNFNVQGNYKEENKMKGGDQNNGSYVQTSDGNQTNQSGNKKNEGKSTACNINVAGRERLQNDYNQHFVNSGERPQNFIRDSDENKRFIKYPKLKQLLELKNVIIQKRSTPARYISCDLRTFDLNSLGIKFDVILIDPPWKEYYDRKVHHLAVLNNSSINQSDLNYDLNDERDRYWSLEEIASLQIEKIAEVPSFIFLWCGVTHLEDARYLLNRWGYRRCEDVCWLKTNIQEKNKRIKYLNEINNENSYLQRTTEHCLMGIKGAVRRSYDIHLIHANLDTDVIIAEETEENIYDNNKPQELYKIIEKFCLGRRKIELFGTNRNIRNGWLTLGKNIDTTLFNKDEYISWFEGDIAWPEAKSYIGGKYMGTTNEIENLRPKSPTRNVHS